MPAQPFIMRLHFYLPTGTGLHSLASGAHHVAYAGSKEKAELMIGRLLAESNRNSLESAAIHARYAGEREGSLGYFGSMADDPKGAQKSILAAQGPVWRVINTVGEADALAMGGDLTTKDGWERASKPVVTKMIKELGLDPAKVQWIAAAHRHQKHEHNPHIHLLIWETGEEPTRKTGEWSDAERRAIRKAWISELYRPERQVLGKEKSEARTEARSALIDLVARKNEMQGFNRELTTRLATLGKMLPGRGRLAYAFMPPEIKAKTEEGIRWLWDQDPGLKTQHDRYLETAERMGTFYWHQDPEKTQNTPGRQEALDRIRQNAEHDLIQRLAAPILRAARQQAWAIARDEYREASASVRVFLRDETQAERLDPWIRRFKREGSTDGALIDLVRSARNWPERDQWLEDWLAASEELSEWAGGETGLQAWDTVIQSVVQGAARQRQREELAEQWESIVNDPDHPEIKDRLWAIAEEYATSARTTHDWISAVEAYHVTLPTLSLAGGDLADQRFARHLAHHVEWLDEHRAIAAVVSRADLRRARTDPDAIIDRVIRESPTLQKLWDTAGITVNWQRPFTYRYAHDNADGEWEFTEREFKTRTGALLSATFSDRFEATAFAAIWPPAEPPPGIQASMFDRESHRQEQEQARAALRERVGKHITSIGYECGVYRRASGPDLIGALHRIMWRAEHDARATAYWLAESQWQRKKAESAIARSAGQEIAQ